MIDYETNPDAQVALLVGVLLGIRLGLMLMGARPVLEHV